MNKFANSIAVVTGASSGIGEIKWFFSTVLISSRATHYLLLLLLFSGRGIVTELVKYPEIEVVGLSRSKLELESSNFTFLKCDVANAGDVTNAFNQIENKFPNKKISILINNAGMSKVNNFITPELGGHPTKLVRQTLPIRFSIQKILLATSLIESPICWYISITQTSWSTSSFWYLSTNIECKCTCTYSSYSRSY